jgi:broad specificity phosphatase PhoE
MPATPTPMASIVFLRHGETDWNAEGRLQGQRDVPLNQRGRGQAKRNGEVLKQVLVDVGSFEFVASPLARARQTMEIAREAMGLDPGGYRTDDRLREVTFGRWEGFTAEEIRAREPGELAAREADKWGVAPPGGESYEGLAARVRPWLNEIERPTVVVAHGGIGRVLWIELAGLDPAKAVAITIPHDRVFLWSGGGVRLL